MQNTTGKLPIDLDEDIDIDHKHLSSSSYESDDRQQIKSNKTKKRTKRRSKKGTQIRSNRTETWTRLGGATYNDSNLPIYSLKQTSTESYHTLDTQIRLPLNSPEYPVPSKHILHIYDFIIATSTETIESTSACSLPTSSSTHISTSIGRSNKKSFIECCGFSASIVSAQLWILMLLCNQRHQQLMDCFKISYFNKILKNGFNLTYNEELIYINKYNIHQKLYRFFMLISGYAKFKGIGWNERCPENTILSQGINLVSLTGPIVDGGCDTYHHFTVYVNKGYCIIFDSWAGGDDGCRGPWIRIMQTNDLQNLFNEINDYSNDYNFLTEIFKNYFNAPNKLGTMHVDHHVQVGILNSNSGLDTYIWKYLYGMRKGSASKLSNIHTQEILEEIDAPIIIPISKKPHRGGNRGNISKYRTNKTKRRNMTIKKSIYSLLK